MTINTQYTIHIYNLITYVYFFDWYREVQEIHILTVGVKDRITPTKKNFARVVIQVRDYNDHAPRFLLSMYNGSVLETAAVGSWILQVVAVDADKESNGHITYSIVSGEILIRRNTVYSSSLSFLFSQKTLTPIKVIEWY